LEKYLGMKKSKIRLMGVVGISVLMSFGLSSCTFDKVQPEVCFESEVLPIFRTYCSTAGCHNSQDLVEGYDFSSYNGIRSAVRPGSPRGSELFEVMVDAGDDHMPPAGSPQPNQAQIDLIEKWIKTGADNSRNCGQAACDTTTAATYSGDIQPMLSTFCIGCHTGANASGGVDLSSFGVVQSTALSGVLEGVLVPGSGFTQMPPNSPSPLPSCNVIKIRDWVAQGAPQN
jgi:hypothetical protein